MAVVVVDASAAVDLLRRTPAGRQVGHGLRAATAASPALFDAEVFSALGRLARDGVMSSALVAPALVAPARAPIQRLPAASLLEEAWSLGTTSPSAAHCTWCRPVGWRQACSPPMPAWLGSRAWACP